MSKGFFNWRGLAERVNRRLIERKGPDFSGLSPTSIRLIKETRFTAEQINAAFANARGLQGNPVEGSEKEKAPAERPERFVD